MSPAPEEKASVSGSPSFSSLTKRVCSQAITAVAVCPPAVQVTSTYSLSGASSFKETHTRPSSIYCRACATASGVQSFRTCNLYSERPMSAPSAMATGSPVMPVPGIPTPIAFLRIFALSRASIFSGVQPSNSVARLTASATHPGSVQPTAGTTCRRTSAVICCFSSKVSISLYFVIVKFTSSIFYRRTAIFALEMRIK